MTRHKRLRQLAAVLETGNLLFLKLVFQNRGRAHIFPNAVFADYMKLGGRAPWKCSDIFDFLPELRDGNVRVCLDHRPGEGMCTPVNELAFMAMVCAALQPKLVFEFGTYRGRTALNFALNSPPECKIYTLDLPEGESEEVATSAGVVDARVIRSQTRNPGVEWVKGDVAHKITQLYGNSLYFDPAPFEGKADLVFVDGGHSYEVASKDTENALRMCRPGGIVLWHDFANYGQFHDVTRAILDQIPGDQIVQLENTWLAGYRKPLSGAERQNP